MRQFENIPVIYTTQAHCQGMQSVTTWKNRGQFVGDRINGILMVGGEILAKVAPPVQSDRKGL